MSITGTVPTKLSKLGVDTHLDMQGYNILDVGRVEQLAIAYESREVGESINAYDVVYMDGSLIKKADAHDRNKMPVAAMAIASGTLGDLIDCWFRGIVSNNAWSFTSGSTLFLMSGGVIGHSAPDVSGDVIQSLGKALTRTTIHFQPEDTIMVVGA